MTDKKHDEPAEEIKDEDLGKVKGGIGLNFNTASGFNTATSFNTANRFLTNMGGIDQTNDSPLKR